MARGSAVWYVVASLIITLAVYEIFLYTGYDRTLGPFLTALVYVFTFPVGIAAWVYQDAAGRGWNGGFWAAVTIFVPLGIVRDTIETEDTWDSILVEDEEGEMVVVVLEDIKTIDEFVELDVTGDELYETSGA